MPSATVPHTLMVSDPQPQSAEARPLPGARDESHMIRTIILDSGGEVKLLEGEEARRPNVLEILQKKRLDLTHAHFACHGLAELADPLDSGILLAYGARLMTRTLLDLVPERFPQLRLVVLSACQTGLPGADLPDEVVGLPSGWLQSGAMTVLASLWPVSDSMTVALMTKFYELHLRDGLDPVKALWLAQRWLRGLPTWRADCQAADALYAAKGAEASEVVHELALTRGETTLLDDLRDISEDELAMELVEHVVPDIVNGDLPMDSDTDGYLVSDKQHEHWESARHWAAFVIYGA